MRDRLEAPSLYEYRLSGCSPDGKALLRVERGVSRGRGVQTFWLSLAAQPGKPPDFSSGVDPQFVVPRMGLQLTQIFLEATVETFGKLVSVNDSILSIADSRSALP